MTATMKRILVATSWSSQTAGLVITKAVELAQETRAELRQLTAPELTVDFVSHGLSASGAELLVVGAEDPAFLDELLRRIDRSVYIVREKPSAALRREHSRIDTIALSLIDAYADWNWPHVRRRWELLEPALRDQMASEEELLFRFHTVQPEEADALLAGHEEIRQTLGVLRVELAFENVSENGVADFVARLRAHAAHKERSFYPWIDGYSA
jgi:hypothetical protein